MAGERKSFRLKITETKDDGGRGLFSGWLSIYGNTDAQGDVVERGAFRKTLQDKAGKFPLLWQHDAGQPVGFAVAEDRAKGLWIDGTLLIDDVQRARECYALIKASVVSGLSIGYNVVRKEFRDGARHLLEIALHEASLCVFPANELATIEAVKTIQPAEAERFLKSILKAADAAVDSIRR